MFRFALASVGVLALAACATAPPPAPPERLLFAGTLDLSQPGIGFHLSHESGLACDARYGSGRLPETVTVQLICNDQQSGTLTVMKAVTLSGTVALPDGRTGDVTFEPPLPPPRVAVVAPSPPVQPPAVAATTTIVRTPAIVTPSTGYVRAHTRRGGYVRGHYRKGKWVSGHSRRGTTVRGHYRRR